MCASACVCDSLCACGHSTSPSAEVLWWATTGVSMSKMLCVTTRMSIPTHVQVYVVPLVGVCGVCTFVRRVVEWEGEQSPPPPPL